MYNLSTRALLALCLGFVVAAYFAVRFPGLPGTSVGSTVSTLLTALPAFAAFAVRFGARRAALSLAALSLFGFCVEITGVATGFPYGEFRYSDALGPTVAGLVPLTLPISWAPLVLGAVGATEPRGRGGRGDGRVGWALRAAALLVAVDAVLDPGAARLGFWVWEHGGPYYGVPLSNFAGWLLSSSLAAALLLLAAPWRSTRPVPGLLDSAIIALAFWTSVALFSGLLVPLLLGCGLLAYLLRRRRLLAAGPALAHLGERAST